MLRPVSKLTHVPKAPSAALPEERLAGRHVLASVPTGREDMVDDGALLAEAAHLPAHTAGSRGCGHPGCDGPARPRCGPWVGVDVDQGNRLAVLVAPEARSDTWRDASSPVADPTVLPGADPREPCRYAATAQVRVRMTPSSLSRVSSLPVTAFR
jgi:hypothetical protein